MASLIGSQVQIFCSYELSDGSFVHLKIIDTDGQYHYRPLNESNYKRADCCILVFDKTNKKSFNECQDYFSDKIREKCKRDVKVILVGNKIDLENEIEVSYEEAANFALLNDYLYIETSCVRNINVFETFEKIIGLAYLAYLKSKGKTITSQDDKKDFSMKLFKFYSY